MAREVTMNECEQNCVANQDGKCIYYRLPVWQGFATQECAENVNKMLEQEEEGLAPH